MYGVPYTVREPVQTPIYAPKQVCDIDDFELRRDSNEELNSFISDKHTQRLMQLKNNIKTGRILDLDADCDPGELKQKKQRGVKAEGNMRKIVELSDDEEIALAEGVIQTASGHLIVQK